MKLFGALLFFGLGVMFGGQIQQRSMIAVIAQEVEAQTARLSTVANEQAKINETLGCTMDVLRTNIQD